MKRVCTIVAALILASMFSVPYQALAEEGATESEYSVFYSEPARVDALFAAFLDAFPAQTFDDVKLSEWDSCEPIIGEKELAALEVEFGDMPEYWQLRYSLEEDDETKPLELLLRATGVAPDDSNSLFLYGMELLASRSYDECDKDVARNWPQLPAQVIEQASDMDGGNAYMYYMAAQPYMVLGECEHAVALLEKGNSCPHNDRVGLFPYSYLARHADELDEIVGLDRIGVAMALQGFWPLETLPSYIRLKDTMKEFCVIANLGGDTDVLNIAHLFVCRLGQTEHATMLDVLGARVLISTLANHIAALSEPLSAEESAGYSRLSYHLGRIEGMLRGGREVMGWYFFDAACGNWLDVDDPSQVQLSEEEEAEFLRAFCVAWFKQAEVEYMQIPQMAGEVFEWLEAFDYANPAAYRGY